MPVFDPDLNNMSEQNLHYLRKLQQVRFRLTTLLMLCALLLSATLVVHIVTQTNMKYIIIGEAVLSVIVVIYVLREVKKCRLTEMAVMTAHANKLDLKQLMNYDLSKFKDEITEVHVRWQRNLLEYGMCAMITVEAIFTIIVFGFLL
jgi:hypothetical protein